MPSLSLNQLLDRLEESKTRFDAKGIEVVKSALAVLGRRRFDNAEALIRFHEALLFLRAYPPNQEVVAIVDGLLSSFSDRVDLLRVSGADVTAFDFIENSGIAGTAITGTFSYAIVRWLVDRYPAAVSIDWHGYEKGERLGQALPRFLPLLYEDSLVEANIPYTEWLDAVTGNSGSQLRWLLSRFDQIELFDQEKAELFDSLELKSRWDLGNSAATRTHSKRRVKSIFWQTGPLIKRKDVSLEREIRRAAMRLKHLSHKQALPLIDMLREATTVRYRELYGITHSDPGSAVQVKPGRGVEIFLWGLPVDRRLPVRAYHAGFTLKNGVPINYIEGISLFDRMEVGFNMFYTFREGESAWIYAQILRLLHQVSGVTCFSVDPYQIGFNNEEAIESGAFWFYRKLGFRPTRPELAMLMEAEEHRMKAKPGYRSSKRILERLARGNAVYEVPGSSIGYWDGFHIRNIGLAVQRRIATAFGGDSEELRAASREEVSKALGIGRRRKKNKREARTDGSAFDDLALVLGLIPDLAGWSPQEKREIERIIHAKSGENELEYLRLMQRHTRLRDAIRAIGCS